MPPIRTIASPRAPRGYTLLEVLVSLAVLVTGVAAIMNFLPMTLRHNERAMDVSIAVYLAQLKVEEIRRDNDGGGALIGEIEALTTPSLPVRFAYDPRLTYSLSGVSLLDSIDSFDDPRDDRGVARVIVRYSADYDPDEPILYELRFDD